MEAKLPKRHLIAQNYANFVASVRELAPNVGVVNFHYSYPAAVEATMTRRVTPRGGLLMGHPLLRPDGVSRPAPQMKRRPSGGWGVFLMSFARRRGLSAAREPHRDAARRRPDR